MRLGSRRFFRNFIQEWVILFHPVDPQQVEKTVAARSARFLSAPLFNRKSPLERDNTPHEDQRLLSRRDGFKERAEEDMEDTQRLGRSSVRLSLRCRVKLPGMLYPPLIPALSVIIGASVVSSLPRQLEPVEFFEEDIILSDEEMRVILGQEEQVDYYRDIGGGEWPRGVLYYDFAPGEFGPSQTSAVLDAMAEIERYSCVRFQRRTAAEPTYVLLRNTGGQG
ncbi:hypothetical protein AAG570_004097 [Ranatra chinensis]|uniref:Peptidase M12A domain-containing protein n=1 Tax=Ranatra chinensis TaxID=642074 RepID=A0ABD0Y2S9_9HEMI